MVREVLYVRGAMDVLFSIVSSQDPFFTISLRPFLSFGLNTSFESVPIGKALYDSWTFQKGFLNGSQTKRKEY